MPIRNFCSQLNMTYNFNFRVTARERSTQNQAPAARWREHIFRPVLTSPNTLKSPDTMMNSPDVSLKTAILGVENLSRQRFFLHCAERASIYSFVCFTLAMATINFYGFTVSRAAVWGFVAIWPRLTYRRPDT